MEDFLITDAFTGREPPTYWCEKHHMRWVGDLRCPACILAENRPDWTAQRPPDYYMPQVGDIVRLTDGGMEMLGGVTRGPEAQAALFGVAITFVGEETFPGNWDIDLAAPLDRYLMGSAFVVLLRRP